MADKIVRDGWQLLVRLEIDESRRVQCQCLGCGKSVYADVHIIQWPDGEIACWGSRCFEREMGIAGKKLQAVYSRVNGRKLTDEERDLLDANREALIARIKGIEEEIVQAEKRREQALKIVYEREREEERRQREDESKRRKQWSEEERTGPKSQHNQGYAQAMSPSVEESVCELCGNVTTKWYAYDNKTKKCKCMDCYRRLSKQS